MGATRVAVWIGRVLPWSVTALLAQSILWADVPWSLKALVVSVAALSAWRPHYGLIATAGLVPFGNVLATRLFHAYTAGVTEAIVLAFLAGMLVPWRRRAAGPRADALSYGGLIFAAVIVATCAVQFSLERALRENWDRFAIDTVRHLSFEYLAQSDGRTRLGLGFLQTAFLWLEGTALFFATRSICRTRPSLWRPLIVIAVVSAAGAASFTWTRLVRESLQAGMSPFAMLEAGYRWTAAIPSINPSGSYFAMTSLLAVGLAWQARGWLRALWTAVAAFVAVAAYVTQSRAAILVLVAMAAAMLARRVLRGWRQAAIVVALAAIALLGVIQFINPFDVVRADSSESIRQRGLLAQGALGMIRANPSFGVGLGQFRFRFADYRPPEAAQIRFNQDDPHNHLLGIASELGLVGLATFVWFVGLAAWRAARVVRARPLDGAAIGLFCGVAAFLLTCLSHQPLHVPIAAFTFWMLLGACQVAAQAGAVPAWSLLRAPAAPALRTGLPRSLTWATVAAVAALLISVPYRAIAATARLDMTKITYGLHDWDRDGRGTLFRWTTDHATMFLSSEMSLINLPIGASLGGTRKRVEVIVYVEGQRTGQLSLSDERWQEVRLVAPRTGRKWWRIDLYVSPTVVPMEINPAFLDARRLGVRVGEVVQRELLK